MVTVKGYYYVVMSEGDVKGAFETKSEAYAFENDQNLKARERVLQDWGMDDPEEKDLCEASFQAGRDGDYYETVRVDLTGKDEDDMVVLPDGTEIDVSKILDNLMHLDEF